MATAAHALQLLHSGQIDAALGELQRVHAETPADGLALAELAGALNRAGHGDAALRCYERALLLLPDRAELWFNAANARAKAERTEEAEDSYRRALAIAPQMAPAWFNLARLLQRLGRDGEALACYDRAIGIQPTLADAHMNRGNCLRALGRVEESIASHRRAIGIAPERPEAHLNLGNALRDAGHSAEAALEYRRALAINPSLHAARLALADILASGGERDGAIALLREAQALYPDHAGYPLAYGKLLYAAGSARDALPALEHAVRLAPDDATALNALGVTLQATGATTRALECFERSRRLAPRYAAAHANYGQLCREIGRIKDGVEALRVAVSLEPEDPVANANLIDVLVQTGFVHEAIALAEHALARGMHDAPGVHTALGHAHCSAGMIEASIAHLQRALDLRPRHAASISNLLFATLYADFIDVADKAERHKELAARIVPDPAGMSARAPGPARHASRIGFVSADLRSHPVGYFIGPLLEHLDRGRFEIYCYSDAKADDARSAQLRALTPNWRDSAGWDNAQLFERIRDDDIDLLIDLAGHTAYNRLPLFAARPARRHATYLGYPFGTGLEAMDFLVADDVAVPPPDETLYRERVLRLPNCLFCMTPHPTAPNVSPLPAARNGFLTFACYNSLAKFTPAALALWALVLRAVPDARLRLRALGLNDDTVRARVLRRFAEQGIDAGRIDLLSPVQPIAEFLHGYDTIDMALDPIPYNGGTTTVEALWQGVPVLTLPGRGLFARMGASILTTAGLPGFIAADADDLAARARFWAGKIDELAAIRSRLREQLRSTSLVDGARFARGFEQILTQAVA